MSTHRGMALLALIATLCGADRAHAQPSMIEMDLGANAKWLDSHFARYGYAPRAILREDKGLRFRLSESSKGSEQMGLYSYFAIAGDFEISARYDALVPPEPKDGYGMTWGVAVESQVSQRTLAIGWGSLPGKGTGYVVTSGVKIDGQMKYETLHFPSTAKSGWLGLRRKKAEITCLVGEGPLEPLGDLCVVKFPSGTVRPVRLFADRGGSPAPLDARISYITVRAEEITGGVPLHESSNKLAWLVGGSCALAAGGLAVYIRRRRQAE